MAYLALDLGAGSGRAIVGIIEDGKIKLDEIHRFANSPVKLGDTLYWDFLSLYANIKEGIRLAVKKGYNLKGIAVDTWGVDFGLIDKSGKLLGNPVCYRDLRTEGMSEKSSAYISKEELYAITGIQQMEINSLFQLLSLKVCKDQTLSVADKLLFTPDLINFFLTGIACNEYTIASTSQLLNAQTRQWDEKIFEKLNLPSHLMSNIVHPCSLIGKLNTEIAEETGALDAKVFAVGSHDTASAIAAIPTQGDNWAFLSSGTWSLLGVLTNEPILAREVMLNDFTNEGGVDNKILFMRNITGLWLLQRLIAEWEKDENPNCSYDYLLSECEKSKPFRSIVNSDDPSFTHPVSMSKAIQAYCERTGQHVPQSKGEFVRCVLESLAVKYYFVMDKLQKSTGKDIKQLFVVGGGSQNELLNQYIANILNMDVIVGLTESTAIGNVIQQAIANNEIADWEEGHKIIRNSFTLKTYKAQNFDDWINVISKTKHLFE
ncbi:rhamnulokinase [Dysgonomonas sp. ZJ279]|uniref:rhamnulokinase n=1 Tax=Dysgonomonas sp. ZJ279 TaxID=2709796 RepID=UPI0013EBA140|nr:rhamnulokinase family protein [Dysgonomonas sp. ZJ279]